MDENISEESVKEKKIAENGVNLPNSNFESEPAQPKQIEDDLSQADNREQDISPSGTNVTNTNVAAMNEPISTADSELSLGVQRNPSTSIGKNSRPLNAGRASNDPRISPRRSPASPVLENASRAAAEPYLDTEKRIIFRNTPKPDRAR